jgi:hypothetical protein
VQRAGRKSPLNLISDFSCDLPLEKQTSKNRSSSHFFRVATADRDANRHAIFFPDFVHALDRQSCLVLLGARAIWEGRSNSGTKHDANECPKDYARAYISKSRSYDQTSHGAHNQAGTRSFF